MKKIIRHTLCVLSMMMMSACMLTMDESSISEDEKGKNEP